MYADGVLGNKGMLQIMGSLTTAVFNYMRAQHSQPYTLKSILNTTYGYLFNDVELTASDSLLLFMSQAQGFSLDRFKKE